jgi:hypothetical protein
MGYKNRITRKQGGETQDPPCEIEHIFLSDAERDALKMALRPFIEGASPREGLGIVIKNPRLFPAQALEKLSALREVRDLRTLIALNNLPEIKPEDIPHYGEQQPLKSWLVKNTFAAGVIEGVFQALGVEMDMGVILRQSGGFVSGGNLHKDNRPFAALSAVKSDGAATRFTDFASVLAELHRDPILSSAHIDVNGKKTRIAEFQHAFPNWETQERGLQIHFSAGQAEALEKRFEAAVSQHSVNLNLGPGMAVFWGNKGRVFHQALTTEQGQGAAGADKDDTFSRIAIAAAPPRSPNVR